MSIKQRLSRFLDSDKGLSVLYLPAVLLILFLVFYPLCTGVVLSFTNWNGYSQNQAFIGMDNYRRLLQDSMFYTALKNTVIYGVGSTLIQTLLGLAYAVLLQRKFLGRDFARVVIYIPVMVAQVIIGYVWYFIVQYDRGALNDIVLLFGGEAVDWMAKGTRAVLFITLINGFNYVGKTMIIFLAGLQGIPESYYEAASLDGAGAWQAFRYITVPQLMPAFTTNILLNLIGGLKLFGLVLSTSGGGPGFSSHSLSTLISYLYFDNQSAGYSAAVGFVTFILIFGFSFAVRKATLRKAVDLT